MTTQNSNITPCCACQRTFPLDDLDFDLRCKQCNEADCDEQRCSHRSAEADDAARAELWESFAPTPTLEDRVRAEGCRAQGQMEASKQASVAVRRLRQKAHCSGRGR